MQQPSRREFMAVGLAGAAGLAFTNQTQAGTWFLRGAQSAQPGRETYFEFKPVHDRVIAVTGGGGNAAIWKTPKAQALLVDCKHVHLGYTLRREIDAQGYKLSKVINTHHHMDHTGGNYAFNLDSELTAHTNLTPRVRNQFESAKSRARNAIGNISGELSDAQRHDYIKLEEKLEVISADDFVPDVEMTESETEVRLGEDHVVELRYIGKAHTDNDVFLFFPEENVMHTGDLLFHELHPYIDVSAGATTRGWQTCLAEMIATCDSETVVIPGHGEITDVEGLRKQDRYFEQMRDFVSKARKEGKTRDEVSALEPEFSAGYGLAQLRGRNLSVLFDELEREGG